MTESFAFEAKISQLLKLLSHSLYQNREIALRELISNASDALDKQRHAALLDSSLGDEEELRIVLRPIAADDSGGGPRLEISDNGIGMSRDDLIANLGTIARSGSLDYLEKLASEGAEASPELIGQFGVGFYSAFMLADRVDVVTKPHGGEAHRWSSDGSGQYEIEPAERESRGTTIVLNLKDEAAEFADPNRLRGIVRKYSTYLVHPIFLVEMVEPTGDDAENEDDAASKNDEAASETGGETLSRLNEQRPIWREPKSQVTAEQYEGFFKHLVGGFGEPLWHVHFSFDSPLQCQAILYAPTMNLEAAGFGKFEHGLSLCARRVLVQDDCQKLLPEYLRFLHGIVDSDDLPLNVSREALQDSSVFAKISRVLTKKVLDHIASLADDEPETFGTFLTEFGPILREGINDFAQRDRIAALLRFATTDTTASQTEGDPLAGKTSLDAYVERMATGQEQIYFAVGLDAESLRANPQVAALAEHELEVLLLDDPIDGFVLEMLGQWKEHRFVPIDSGDLKLPEHLQEKLASETAEVPAGFEAVVSLLSESLGQRVKDVRKASRPSAAAAVLIVPEDAPTAQMQRMMAAQSGQAPPPRILELNPKNELVQRLAQLAGNDQNRATIERIGRQLYHNATLAAGLMPDVSDLLTNSDELLRELAEGKSSLVL